MPRRDGTGPMGMGSMAGSGLGICTGEDAVKYYAGIGLGLGCRRGFRRNFSEDTTVLKTQKEFLTEQKELLVRRLDVITKQLDSL